MQKLLQRYTKHSTVFSLSCFRKFGYPSNVRVCFVRFGGKTILFLLHKKRPWIFRSLWIFSTPFSSSSGSWSLLSAWRSRCKREDIAFKRRPVKIHCAPFTRLNVQYSWLLHMHQCFHFERSTNGSRYWDSQICSRGQRECWKRRGSSTVGIIVVLIRTRSFSKFWRRMKTSMSVTINSYIVMIIVAWSRNATITGSLQ